MGAGSGWRGVNPIRDLVAPPDFMLIRWQTYRSKGGLYRGKTTRIRAILSESIRVDGQSRQKFIAVIGSVVAEGSMSKPVATSGKRLMNGSRPMSTTTTAARSKPSWRGAYRRRRQRRKPSGALLSHKGK